MPFADVSRKSDRNDNADVYVSGYLAILKQTKRLEIDFPGNGKTKDGDSKSKILCDGLLRVERKAFILPSTSSSSDRDPEIMEKSFLLLHQNFIIHFNFHFYFL